MKKNLLEPRVYYKPFDYPEAFNYYEQSEKMHWLAEEVPMYQDVLDWKNKLTDKQKTHLTQVFRFFTQSDVDIAGAYVEKYLPMFPKPEIRMMLLSFAARETVHIKAYSHLIDTLGMPEVTYKQFMGYESMRNKHELYIKILEGNWVGNPEKNIAYQMAIFSGLVEGMQLFSSFVMLLNFTRFNLMNGMGQIISWSIRDESLHCEGMSWLFKQFIKENRHIWNDDLKSAIYSTATKMIYMEDAFIDTSYGSDSTMMDLNRNDLKQYSRYIADRRLIGIGLKPIFKVKDNPLPWVAELINAPEHASFFETRATAYSKSSTTGSWDEVWV